METFLRQGHWEKCCMQPVCHVCFPQTPQQILQTLGLCLPGRFEKAFAEELSLALIPPFKKFHFYIDLKF
jgi:hypothetical protein